MNVYYFRLPIIIIISFICSILLTTKIHGNNFKVFTVNDGLTINEVSDIYQDKVMKYIWVGTQNGLNRYNGHHFLKIYNDESSSSGSNFINDITEDDNHSLWLATTKGLACYNYIKEQWIELPTSLQEGNYSKLTLFSDRFFIGIKEDSLFTIKLAPSFKFSFIKNHPTASFSDIAVVDGCVYLASSKGLFTFNSSNNTLSKVNNTPFSHCQRLSYLKKDKALWVISNNSLFRIPVQSGKILLNQLIDGNLYLKTSLEIYNIICYNNSFIVTGTNSGNAVEIIEIQDSEVKNQTVLTDYGFRLLFPDQDGNIWGGTWQSGLVMFPYEPLLFSSFKKSNDVNNGLQSRLIRNFCELDENYIAIATETVGLILFNKKNLQFSKPVVGDTVLGDYSFSVNGNILHTLKKDWKGRIWAGYHNAYFNVLYGHDKEKINQLIETLDLPVKICDDFLFDSINAKVYILNRNKIYEFDDSGYTFTEKEVNIRYLSTMHKFEENIWLGGRTGLRIYNHNFNRENCFLDEQLQNAGLYNADICCFHSDKENTLWIGTYGGGIFQFDSKTSKFSKIIPPQHVDFKIAYSINSDSAGTLWIGTDNGLYSYKPHKQLFNRFDISDGIQGNQFNYNSTYTDKKGTIYIGGINGFTYFRPEQIKQHKNLDKPVISELRIGDKAEVLYINQKLRTRIKIPYKRNSFRFSFFAQNFVKSENYVYSYHLKGYTQKYQLCASNMPQASFTNVPAGKYVLEVKVTRPNTAWSEVALSPKIIILRPWYKSIVALVVYGVLLGLIFLLAVYLTKREASYKNSLEIARIEKENSERISTAKLSFFTDIAHEIRTPLTLIFGPINDLLSKRKFDSRTQNTLHTIQKSTYKLMGLMDELLMFRKAESGSLPIQLGRHDINEFIDHACQLYSYDIKLKNIRLTYPRSDKSQFFVFDRIKLEKVITNLLSNAIKFTPSRGQITIETIFDEGGFRITMTDTGRGMEKKEMDHVFRRFYSKNHKNWNGIGIGLALSKRIVDLHSGKLTVRSDPGRGSVFTISIPKLETNVDNTVSQIKKEILFSSETNQPEKKEGQLNGKILLVEDNDEIRHYTQGILNLDYQISTSVNGQDGYEHALKNIPDLIISDYQMPIMDGITMCKKLKAEILTSHIPIIMLSAFNEIEDQIKGLETGAHDYIGKPFNREVLLNKVKNILESRKRLIKSFKTETKINISHFDKPDQRFLDQINRIILAELSNEQLDVPFICGIMKISKTTLNLKLKNMLDISPALYIRKTRLKEAYRLITEKDHNATEAAIAIGMPPSYFNTVFKKEFGVPPGKLR